MKREIALVAALLVVASAACEVPGTASPTPFEFPTPNLTLTAIYAPTGSPTPQAPTDTPEPTDSARPTAAATSDSERGAPTATASDPDTRPNGSPITAPRIGSEPTIDGSLEDWPEQRHALNEVVFGADNWSGGDDLSGSYAVLWDATNLYLAVEVNDDTFAQAASGRELFQGDSAEILLDEALTADFSSSVLSNDDFQVGLSPGNFDGLEPEAYRWFPRSVEGRLTTTVVAATSSATGYVLEAEIPWIVFGVEPSEGARYGFVVSLSDNDRPGVVVQQSMVSSVRTRTLTDPTTWGTLVLGTGD